MTSQKINFNCNNFCIVLKQEKWKKISTKQKRKQQIRLLKSKTKIYKENELLSVSQSEGGFSFFFAFCLVFYKRKQKLN